MSLRPGPTVGTSGHAIWNESTNELLVKVAAGASLVLDQAMLLEYLEDTRETRIVIGPVAARMWRKFVIEARLANNEEPPLGELDALKDRELRFGSVARGTIVELALSLRPEESARAITSLMVDIRAVGPG